MENRIYARLLPSRSEWETECMAGQNAGLQTHSRNLQNKIIQDFRRDMVQCLCVIFAVCIIYSSAAYLDHVWQVYVIVVTLIREEVLYVQSCHLVVGLDLLASCRFIQSVYDAQMQNSDYLLLGERCVTFWKQNYLICNIIT